MKQFLFIIITVLSTTALSFDGELYDHLKKVQPHSQCTPEELSAYNHALIKALNTDKNYLTMQGLTELKKLLSVAPHREESNRKINPITGFRHGHGSDSILMNQLKLMPAENAAYFFGKLHPYSAPNKSLHDSLEVLTPEEFCLVNYYGYAGTRADKIEKELKDLFATIEAIENLPFRRNVYAIASYIYRRLVGIHPFFAGNGRVAELVVNNYLVRNRAGSFKLPPASSLEYIQFNQYLRSALVGELARKIYPYKLSGSDSEHLINQAERVNKEIQGWFKSHHDTNWEEDFNGKSYLRSFIGFCRKK